MGGDGLAMVRDGRGQGKAPNRGILVLPHGD